MSMQTLTMLQIAWTFSAYTIAVLGLPWLVLHKKFAGYAMEERWMGYFLAGNFYLINLVFVLQLLHISNRFTLILGTVGPFLLLYLRKNQPALRRNADRAQKRAVQILRGERTLKTEFRKLPHGLDPGTRNKLARWLRENGMELVCMLVLIAAIFYQYGLDTIRFYGYKASDVVVHNAWINLMDQNKIFQAGVYPHGFHCIIYYLEQVFGIPTYVLLRVFALTETFYIHLAVLIPLRGFCKNRYIPYAGVIGYVLFPLLRFETYQRYVAALPQEYGMLFILPTGFFALRYFKAVLEKQNAQNEKEACAWSRHARFDLTFLIISFSLTLAVHFYDTMIAGLFCIGVALACWKILFTKQCFRQIVCAGILSIVLAVLPMAVGMLQGNALQGSLYWGLNVIGDSVNDGTETGTGAGFSIQKVGEKLLQFQASVKGDAVGKGTLSGNIVTDGMIAGGFFLLLLGWLEYRRNQQGKRWMLLWAVGWLDLMVLLMMEASLLHLPSLMDSARSAIFYNYVQAMVCPFVLDEVLCGIVPKRVQARKTGGTVSFALLLAGVLAMIAFRKVRQPCTSYEFESNQAMTCTTNIIQEDRQFEWTICSANDEQQMILSRGYHEDLITFLRKLDDIENEQEELTIPTRYVYFYIEKMPIDYYESVYDARGRMRVSEEGASEPLSMEDTPTPYQGTNRWVTMSHIYYWAQAFRKLYPDAMQVYYEDEDFVCYRLTQNMDSLYDLAIDYGYNED